MNFNEQWFCEHIGGFGPPFPFCSVCAEKAERQGSQMNAAKFQVDFELLKEVMLLPEDTKIWAVHMDVAMQLNGYFEIYVEHPDLPEKPEGGLPVTIAPIYRNRHIPEFESWGTKREAVR